MKNRLLFLDLRGDRPHPLCAPPMGSVLCLGNFDGVHRAHAELLAAGQSLAKTLPPVDNSAPREASAACGVFCFFRPSGDYFPAGNRKDRHLTTLRDKLALFAEAGMDFAVLCDFPSVRALSPTAFMRLLTEECGCRGVACGFNFRFGNRAEGGPEMLAAHFGAEASVILPAALWAGEPVSASRIRTCLQEGDMASATALLGRPYSLTATVTHGKQLGRAIGFPTANQYFPPEILIPAHGVYATLCHTAAGIFPGVSNIGSRPTVDMPCARVNCETHIMGYNGDLYGQRMKVSFLTYLRPETCFASIEELTAAIRRDAEAAAEAVRAYRESICAPVTPAPRESV